MGNTVSYEILIRRYGPGFAQEVCDRLDDIQTREISVFDIMELNNLAHEYRQRVKELIGIYRAAQGKASCEASCPRRVYAAWEMVFMRRQISDLWVLMQMTRDDSRELTKEYMRRLNVNAYTPSLPTVSMYRAVA